MIGAIASHFVAEPTIPPFSRVGYVNGTSGTIAWTPPAGVQTDDIALLVVHGTNITGDPPNLASSGFAFLRSMTGTGYYGSTTRFYWKRIGAADFDAENLGLIPGGQNGGAGGATSWTVVYLRGLANPPLFTPTAGRYNAITLPAVTYNASDARVTMFVTGLTTVAGDYTYDYPDPYDDASRSKSWANGALSAVNFGIVTGTDADGSTTAISGYPDGAMARLDWPKLGRTPIPATASTNMGQYTPVARMVDGDLTTEFSPNQGWTAFTHYARIDLGSVKNLTEIYANTNFPGSGIWYRLRYSTDATTWTTFAGGLVAINSWTGLNISARYIQIESENSTSDWYHIKELQAYGA